METLYRRLFGEANGYEISNKISEELMRYRNSTNQEAHSQVVSSASLMAVIVPLLLGLSGETLNEVCTALGINSSSINKLVSDLEKVLMDLHGSPVVSMINVMLSRSNVPLHREYLNKLETVCGPVCGHAYFDVSEIATLVPNINIRISDITNGLIPELLKPDDIDPDVFFVLLNAIHFLAEWKTQFEVESTQLGKFSGRVGERQENLMRIWTESFKYFETEKFQALRMPYKDENFSFCVVLPKRSIGTSRASAESIEYPEAPILNSTQIITTLTESQYVDVNVTLPKFTEEADINLIPFFESHGVSKLFNDMEATNMTSDTNRKYVSVIKQKVKIVVSESGTEAAAATAIVCTMESCCMKKQTKVYDFVADHPFTYYIVYEPLNLVLFSGTYN